MTVRERRLWSGGIYGLLKLEIAVVRRDIDAAPTDTYS
jgi:hypothetical protein